MNIEISRINDSLKKSPSDFITSVNEDYLYKLNQIASRITANSEKKPVILLSGPSGSGKTTSAMMICKLLGKLGITTHTLSMDNYFRPLSKEETELAALGKFDLESPLRIDNELLNEQIEAISCCEEIEIPRYNFKTSSREAGGRRFLRRKNELVIFEGIHALNPDVITVHDSKLQKIYVSVRTRISDDGIILHPSRVRLLRRMIRDKNFRKRSLEETMNMFHSVEDGENKYIMPYKHRSDYDVDTFMAYELSAYKPLLIDGLYEMNDIPEISEILTVLERLEPLDNNAVPKESLIREFIGGGEFSY